MIVNTQKLLVLFAIGCYCSIVSPTFAEQDTKTPPPAQENVEQVKVFTLSEQELSSSPEDYALLENDVVNLEFCYYLSGILHINNKQWSVWLNEVQYSQSISPTLVDIMKVEPHRVLLQPKTQGKDKAKWVSFNQTYCVDTNKVAAGDLRDDED